MLFIIIVVKNANSLLIELGKLGLKIFIEELKQVVFKDEYYSESDAII